MCHNNACCIERDCIIILSQNQNTLRAQLAQHASHTPLKRSIINKATAPCFKTVHITHTRAHTIAHSTPLFSLTKLQQQPNQTQGRAPQSNSSGGRQGEAKDFHNIAK